MKRTAISILLVLAMASFEPESELMPVPVNEAKPWQIKTEGKLVTIAYYQHFVFPDGSRTQLKSRMFLDDKGWEALAKKQWEAIQQAELNKPKICPHCGGTGFVP